MIGIFDSGVGGLSILKEINSQLPMVSTVYLADQAYAPYGNKTPALIRERSLAICEFFSLLGIDLVVVARNTATVRSTISDLRIVFPEIQFVGVEPPIKQLAKLTQTNHIAIFATLATCQSDRLKELIKIHSDNKKVDIIATVEWASLVESGKYQKSTNYPIFFKYIKPLLQSNVDYVGLGCTHYPFLRPILEFLAADKLKFIDVGFPVANRVASLYSQQKSSLPVPHTFYTTGDAKLLALSCKNLLGLDTNVESIVI